MSKSWTLEVKEDPENGDCILEFPDDLMQEAGWKEGDTLEWIDNKDGSWTMKKKELTQWVLVECVSTFRERYMVEVPVGIDHYGKDKTEWALDTVSMNEAKEFSQEHLGEQIVSHRVVSKEEALSLCDKDNEYGSSWTEEVKMKNFFTTWKEQKDSK
jgi:hypothetical protein